MNKEKEIEKLTEILNRESNCGIGSCENCKYDDGRSVNLCISKKQAEALYNAGYRKVDEKKWKHIEYLERVNEPRCYKVKKGNIVFFCNILEPYEHKFETLEDIAKELNLMLQATDSSYDQVVYFSGKAEEVRKETAREILQMYSLSDTFSSFQNKIIEKYGVEVEK